MTNAEAHRIILAMLAGTHTVFDPTRISDGTYYIDITPDGGVVDRDLSFDEFQAIAQWMRDPAGVWMAKPVDLSSKG